KDDPEAIRLELKAEIDAVNAIPPDRLLERDESVHAILENEAYTRYGGEARKGIARIHETLHQDAEAQRRARGRAEPFLPRYRSLKSDPGAPAREADRLEDEVKAPRDQFGSTAYGTRLEEAAAEI